ncbi:MAG: hypothetical protein JXP48_03175 [Acidobacteria bacterium]|nr:hypothetical protein [Acidobacteriota bacterium]
MLPGHKTLFHFLSLLLLLACGSLPAAAGVSRAVQQEYRERYEHKAMVLKVPLYGDRQTVRITGPGYRVEPGSGTPRFKVGDQLRVLEIAFSGDQIRFRLSPVTTSETVELSFQFDAGLEDDFPNRKVFDQALGAVLTEGLRYAEIDDARRQFVTGHFERSVRELAEAASISRDAALEQIAPLLPAYQQAKRETASLEGRLQKISAQLETARSENRGLQSKVGSLEAESSRLKRSSSELEERMRASSSQISRLGEELRAAQGTAQGYQKELAAIQRSLNLKAEAGKDLSRQIAELGQALRTLQTEKDTLTAKVASLEKNLEARKAAGARLEGENAELRDENSGLQKTIRTLTSKEDSLARQYLELKNEKEKLDDFAAGVRALRTRLVEEKEADGFRTGKAQVLVNDLVIGSLEWRIPAAVTRGRGAEAEAAFTAESIDYVRATPEEKRVLRSLGDPFRVRVGLDPGAASVRAEAGPGEPVREIRERERSLWTWTLHHQGNRDARLRFSVRLIDHGGAEIGLLDREPVLEAADALRRVRDALRPVPLAVGAVLGFLLFGIVGIFRRPRRPHPPAPRSGARAEPGADHVPRKEL